ncbi:MAG: Coenzyme F420 hydrogenase/dehydrogenase, beta subunit C-terminal domain [Acidaminococcaceae bacterium]|nr:Coenzyme F420 hydrogenase/dehydrogenase, beta subunit C-terminal domain [Acidaminococcaceae bacterium]
MIDIKEKQKCCGCHACFSICPVHAIKMVADEEFFLYPQVDKNVCINCGLCEQVCPSLKNAGNKNCVEAWGAYAKDTEMRLNSSSGGMFTLLAEKVLCDGGVVCGAVMCDDCYSVRHVFIDDIRDLAKLRGSKYLQSVIGDCYVKVKNYLEHGKKVLFSGTPCQVSGLKTFLRRDYDNLLCVDIICHGVPSQALWEKYVKSFEAKHHDKVTEVSFRHKKDGWQDFGMNNTIGENDIFINKDEDEFMHLFLQNFCLRPSCYTCHTKEIGYFSDITIGDFWSVSNVAPELNDNKGTSAIVIRTGKGQKIWNEIKDFIVRKQVEYGQILQGNSSLEMSVAKPFGRETFFKDMPNMTMRQLVGKYMIKQSFGVKVKRLLLKTTFGQWLRKIKNRGGG